MQLPARSTLAGGLSGVAAWLLTLALAHFGIIVPQEAVGAVVALISTIAVHVTPDSIQDTAKALNVDVKSLAGWIPTVSYDYPDQK